MTENKIKEFVQSLRNRLETFVNSGWAIEGLVNDYTKSADTIEKLLEENQQYRALEQKLQSVYGEHDGLLEIIVNGLVKFENTPDKAVKAVLLTDDDVDKWEAYKAIGKVEEFETLKKVHSDCSIKHLAGECSYNETGCSGCKGRELIRTAVERMKPKKLPLVERGLIKFYACPSCSTSERYHQIYSKMAHCSNCGQKLDWSE